MGITRHALSRVVAIAGVSLLAACASQSEVDELRADVRQAQADAAEAKRISQEALATANAAEEKADRIYRESLRK